MSDYWSGRVSDLNRRIHELESELDATNRELERWRHGVPIEGDYVCPDSLRAADAERERNELRVRCSSYKVFSEKYKELASQLRRERDKARRDFGAFLVLLFMAIATVLITR